ncbi:sigma-54-dependent Fis family transcriptional regulator [bacterium]|nr:sigma-54-dependent Fis family transcriptional regulator [bacterium]
MMDILIVDDEPKMCDLLAALLSSEGHAVTTAPNGQAAVAQLESRPFDVVLTDMKMHPGDGMAVLSAAKRIHPDIDVILMTAFADARDAVAAIKAGAYDYLIKPFETDELLQHLARIAEKRALVSENRRLREAVRERTEFSNIIGRSKSMREALRLLSRVAPTDSTILLRGESGTGKELFADAAHFHSPRKNGPLVKINCAAIPEGLLESELFGHEKGAFTGAARRKLGRFELAHKGTLFLDEIGDLVPELQTKLLRFLEEGTITRVGGNEELRLDVRVIAATHRDLETMMRDGRFRQDLYYRLSIFPIAIPPLRERKEDLPELVRHLLARGKSPARQVSPRALELLSAYDWPGNVRELANVLERAGLLCEGSAIQPEDLPESIRALGAPRYPYDKQFPLPEEGINIDELEKQVIRTALAKAGGNKTRAAELLGITRRRLYSRMQSLGL